VAPAPKVDPNAVAATVNGQPIKEMMVQRGLERVDPTKRREARPELINFLVDNLLIEQHLIQLGITVDKDEVEKKVKQMKDEAEKNNTNFDQLLKDLKLSETELREHIVADIRWDKFAASKATDAALKELFEANKEMFDGSMVRARHILITVKGNDEKATQQAVDTLAAVKQAVDAQVTVGLAKLPATADALAREKERNKLVEEAFAAQAREKSSCPSKNEGGDVKWFQRAGLMVEPFARAAFALKPFQISEVVKTQFGCHLIMVTDRRAGKDVKFDDVKEDVKEIFCERLRESVATQVRAKSKIVITPEN
jgi:peptidyl-prolyl cis-trans isomerase C